MDIHSLLYEIEADRESRGKDFILPKQIDRVISVLDNYITNIDVESGELFNSITGTTYIINNNKIVGKKRRTKNKADFIIRLPSDNGSA